MAPILLPLCAVGWGRQPAGRRSAILLSTCLVASCAQIGEGSPGSGGPSDDQPGNSGGPDGGAPERLGSDAGSPVVEPGGDGPIWREYTAAVSSVSPVEALTATDELEAVPGDFYLAVVSVKRDLFEVSVSGLGLTWAPLHSQCAGRNTATLAIFGASGANPVAGPVTATFSGDVAATSAVLTVHRFSRTADEPVGKIRYANTNGEGASASCGGGTDSSTYELPAPEMMGADSLMVLAVHSSSYAHEPAPGVVQRAQEFSTGDSYDTGVAVGDARVSEKMQVSGTFDGEPDWIVVGLELRSGASGP